ncbi:MAG: twin-arginine translocation signal domain-containing protein [Chloroflexota bacterium]|nr:twin-arginine translocation signal domain-containing protein [Chloroflexota bacterium]
MKLTRRGFFKQTTIGAAALGVLPWIPLSGVATSDTAEVDTSELSPAFLSGPLVAHVRDLATGEISVMSGLKEVIFRDPQLVAKLVKAAR